MQKIFKNNIFKRKICLIRIIFKIIKHSFMDTLIMTLTHK